MIYIAHRGESYLAPENTIAAINLAWSQNADAVEMDVRLTRKYLSKLNAEQKFFHL